MPARCRQTIGLLFFEHPPMPYTDVAKRLKVAKGSIGFIRGRCLKRLKKVLEEKGFRCRRLSEAAGRWRPRAAFVPLGTSLESTPPNPVDPALKRACHPPMPKEARREAMRRFWRSKLLKQQANV
jgi:hypothetical protein